MREFNESDCSYTLTSKSPGSIGCRIKHNPSGIVLYSDDSSNGVYEAQANALTKMQSFFADWEPPEIHEQISNLFWKLLDEKVAATVEEQLPDAIQAALNKLGLV